MYRVLRLVVLVLLALNLTAASCSNFWGYGPFVVELKPTPLPRRQPIRLRAELRIGQDVREAAIAMGVVKFRFGDTLVAHVEALAGSLFAEVVESGGEVVADPSRRECVAYTPSERPFGCNHADDPRVEAQRWAGQPAVAGDLPCRVDLAALRRATAA